MLLHKADRWIFTRQCKRHEGNRVSTSVGLSVLPLLSDVAPVSDKELVSRVDTTCATTSLAPQLIGVVTGT